jgi:hypothetical protein
MLAPDGRCKTLDVAGDGYVRAENCIVLLLEAVLDGEVATAIVQGSAVKQASSSQLDVLDAIYVTLGNKHAPIYKYLFCCSLAQSCPEFEEMRWDEMGCVGNACRMAAPAA